MIEALNSAPLGTDRIWRSTCNTHVTSDDPALGHGKEGVQNHFPLLRLL